MAETESIALKEALLTQQQLLHKLTTELEEEREASATAATEALSMILRLQGEKAAEKMEASQYKRMAEEKINHAEESLAIFEELIFQKEMEIASLEFQVQAYKNKLQSVGLNDSYIGQLNNQFVRRNEAYFKDIGVHQSVKKNNSLPAAQHKDSCSKKGIVGEDGSALLLQELIPRTIDKLDFESDILDNEMHKVSEESAVADHDSYWKQIEWLDKQVDLPHNKDIGIGSDPLKSMEVKLNVGSTLSLSSSQVGSPKNIFELDASDVPCLETKNIRSTSFTKSVHDIFEVPQSHENYKHSGSKKEEWQTFIHYGETRLGKADSVPQGTSDCYLEDKAKCAKNVLPYAKHESMFFKQTNEVKHDSFSVAPPVDITLLQSEVWQLSKRLELLLNDRSIKQEASNRREEELNMLKEIHEKINVVNSDRRNRQLPPLDESPIFQTWMCRVCTVCTGRLA
uniref:GTD-binding domain-containing protein n=1 Tax=Nelumbo nucifera TaxID=4432 RepID=A0A822ZPA1_NELNU|nr:TPA_asm: hypothetical protein HUJ06_003591 [Nelumbo nucifera]